MNSSNLDNLNEKTKPKLIFKKKKSNGKKRLTNIVRLRVTRSSAQQMQIKAQFNTHTPSDLFSFVFLNILNRKWIKR